MSFDCGRLICSVLMVEKGGPPDYPSSESYQGLGGERSDDDGNPTADRQTPVDDEDPAHSLQADDWHGVDDAMNECSSASYCPLQLS